MRIRTLVAAFAAALITGLTAAQQPVLSPAFVAYSCAFERSANQVRIEAVLQGADARTLADSALDLSAEQRGNPGALDVVLTPLAERPPLRLVIVLDLTDTVPIVELTAVLQQDLFENLLPEDEVALITFSEDIAPVTPFVADKQAFANDYLTGLSISAGDNRLYDAIDQAIGAFPFAAGTRRVVLAVTDSGRRQLEQTPIDALIARAQRDNTQIYSIGFVSRDRPDEDELTALASQTGGYFWYYGETNNTRASIGSAVGAYLSDFARALNSEATITISGRGLTPDSNNRAAIDLTAALTDGTELTDQVTCPVETLRHDIAFVTNAGGAPITGRIDIGVNAQSDLGRENTRIVFRVNGEVVQTSQASVYTFDSTVLQPGFYTVQAELWDNANTTLAQTPSSLRLYVQQSLQLTVRDALASPDSATSGTFTGAVDLTVRGNEQIALPDVEFSASPSGRPELAQTIGTAPYVSGVAALSLPDLSAAILSVFPDATAGGTYQIVAVVSGISPGDPPLASSNLLPLTVSVPVPTATPTVQPRPPVPRRDLRIDYGIPLALMLAGLLLNVILVRAIRRRKIKRVIAYPDNIELGPQLMTLTVLRDGVRHAHALTKKTVTIGRGSGNDVNVSDDPNVSRQHGVIMWRRGDWYYSNRKGNATARIDGQVRRGFFLHRLDGVTELQIGDVIMIFHSSAQQDIADFIKTDL
ncbi:MAG: VWA domain-containing protein [Chloroflexi bacterium]|nr:VWA domain-containing protein [Chloroflexota bacterium]